jgi:dTDP-4-amino-4,6-dideoxygalactose transaminase
MTFARPRSRQVPFARPSIGPEEIAAVVEVLESGWITTGERTQQFEADFQASVGAPAALAVNSATAALHLALLAHGIGPGDLVFTTPMTFCSTVHVIHHVGARPVLVDVEPDTLNLDPRRLADAVGAATGGRPAAVIPVHYGGHPCDMDPITSVARENGLVVVEDAAHAQQASYHGRPIGAVDDSLPGHAVCFSFYATKNITTGEGGMLTARQQVVDEARVWSLHGMSRDAWQRYDDGGTWHYDVMQAGFKYNLSDLAAALGVVQLRRAADLRQRRADIAAQYTEAFASLPQLELPAERADVEHAWHLYPVRVHPGALRGGRDALADALIARNIGVSVHFIPVHHFHFYRELLGHQPGDFPVADDAFARILSLPIYSSMSDGEVEEVIDAVADIITRGGGL